MSAAQLVYQGSPIHDRDEMLSLTDMWRAAGSDPNRRPAEWKRQDATEQFVAYIAGTMGRNHSELFQSLNDDGEWNTWAHWQIGMAYAKYLSPEFHAWCNGVVRSHMEGREIPVSIGIPVALSDVALDRFAEKIGTAASQTAVALCGKMMDARVEPVAVRVNDVEMRQYRTEQRLQKIENKIRLNATAAVERAIIHDTARQGCVCPCCRETRVIDQHGRRISGMSQMDHHHAVGKASADDFWLVCIECHQRLSNKRHARHIPRHIADVQFNAFQQTRINQSPQLRLVFDRASPNRPSA